MIRACPVCTLICCDPLRDQCEVCESVLPPTCRNRTDTDSCIVASSSDSGDEELKQRPAKLPRSEGSDNSARVSTQSLRDAPATPHNCSSEVPNRAMVIADDARDAQHRFMRDVGSSPRLLCLELDDDAVTFRVVDHDGDFSIFLSDSYPAGNSCVYGPSDWELNCQGSLSSILESVLDKLASRAAQRESTSGRGDSKDQDSCDRNRASTETLGAPETESEHKREAASPRSNDSDCSEFLLEEDASSWIMEEVRVEKHLQDDLDRVKYFLGPQAVDCIQRADSWRIRLKVQLPTIEVTTAAAWGLDACQPLVVEMQLPMRGYLNPSCMPLKIVTSLWQEGYDDFQLAKQLLQILSDFCDAALNRSSPDFHGDSNPPLADTVPLESLPQGPFARFVHCCQQSAREKSSGFAAEISVQHEFNEKKKNMMLEALEEPWCSRGFLVHIVHYLQIRLLTVNEYCAICDQPFSVTPMFMRTVCTRELCSYQLAEFGERITTADTVNAQAEIADVLVCMFSRAVMSPRHELIVDPYPCITAGRDSKELMFDPKQKNFQKLQHVVTELMKLRDGHTARLGSGWTSLTTSMTHDGRALLQWVVASNRSYLAPLQETNLIQTLRTPFQYLLISAPPDREAKFQNLKKTYGSVFAYHGSGTENWHSILRNGLKNCSNTKYMTAGAAHGAGIYLATRSYVSLNYSMRGMQHRQGQQPPSRNHEQAAGQRQAIGNRSLESLDTLYMLAVCEVINSPVLKKATKDIWVMPNEEMVMTRFFLVFTASNPPGDISIEALGAQIKQCMESLNVGGTSGKP